MEPLRILYWEGLVFFTLLVAVAGHRLVLRREFLLGLVSESPGRRVSWGRVQLLAVTLGLAGWFLWELASRTSGMPRVSGWAVAGFGVSGAAYLMGESWAVLRRR